MVRQLENKAIVLTGKLIESARMIEIRRMTIDDVQLGLKLTRQAGWNQTESDWLRFMNLEPTGCFVAELNGSSVGTITTCLFGQVAWIAMLLVDAGARGRGVGTAMLKHSLNYLEGRKVKTVRLDATSAGQPIYEKLGFVPEYQLARFEGMAPSGRTGPVVTEATPEIFAGIIEFDKRMTGTNRAKMLSRLFEEFPEDIHALWHGDKIEGFIITRPGANAIHIGPCIATTDAGSVLLSDALNRCAAESVFIDIPLDNAGAVRVAESGTLRIQRYFMRMYRGERVKDNIKALWAGSGPEKG
jgi:GNAT superfamily N-acetyltransferase